LALTSLHPESGHLWWGWGPTGLPWRSSATAIAPQGHWGFRKRIYKIRSYCCQQRISRSDSYGTSHRHHPLAFR